MPRKNTPIRDLFTDTETTRSESARSRVWACVRCGWQLVENATRFAKHITRCPKATDEDRRVALDHLARLTPEQLQAISYHAEFKKAFSVAGKAHIRTLFEDTQTTRSGEKARLFRCNRCGHETTENATRFAKHILKCANATEEDHAVAREHEALTEKRRIMRKARQQGGGLRIEDEDEEEAEATDLGSGSGAWVHGSESSLSPISACQEPSEGCADEVSGTGLVCLAELQMLPAGSEFARLLEGFDVAHQGGQDGAAQPWQQDTVLEDAVPISSFKPLQVWLPADEGPSVQEGLQGSRHAADTGVWTKDGSAEYGNSTGPVDHLQTRGSGNAPMEGPNGLCGSNQLLSPFEACEQVAVAQGLGIGTHAAGAGSQQQYQAMSDSDGVPGTDHAVMRPPANHHCVLNLLSKGVAAPSCDLSDLLEGLESLGDGQPYLPASPRPVPPAEVLYPVLLEAAAPTALAEEMEGREEIRLESLADRTLLEPPAYDMHIAPILGQNKRQRSQEAGRCVMNVTVASDEWAQFMRWRQMQQNVTSVPRMMGTSSSLFQALYSYFIGHCKTCASIYASYSSMYGPASSSKLLTSQIRNEWCKLGNVFKTIVTCCAKEHLEVVLDKVVENPRRVLRICDASLTLAQELVSMGHEEAMAKRASMVASMTSDEIAVYKSLERAFRHLSFDDKGEMRDINPESLKRFLATQQYAVNTGPDMRQVVLLALSNSTPDNGSSSSCGLAMDSGNRIVSCIEIEDIQYWAQASQDFLPILDDLIGDEEAAIATCAWMYELYNRIGWDLCMVL